MTSIQPTLSRILTSCLTLVGQRLEVEIEQFTQQPTYQVVFWGQSHPWIVGIGIGVVLLVTAYGAVFLLHPLWLLKLGDGPIQAIANIPHVGTALSGVLKVLLPLKYHPRVLDAWVEQHWQQVEKAFLELKTVDDEYAVACDRLRRMVGQRNITVLLARLYAEQMIEQQQGAGGMLPASVPDVYQVKNNSRVLAVGWAICPPVLLSKGRILL